MKVYIGSDNLLTVEGLYDLVAADYVNTASSVTAKMYAIADQSTQIGDTITLTYVTDSNGNYQGTIPYDLSLSSGTEYIAVITIVATARMTVKVRMDAVYANES